MQSRGTDKTYETETKRIRVMHIAESLAAGVLSMISQYCRALPQDRFHSTVVYSIRAETPADLQSWFGPHVVLKRVRMQRELSLLNDARSLLELTRIVRAERPDVLHLHSSKAGALGRPIGRLCRVKRVYYTPHGWAFLRTDVPVFVRRLYKVLEQMADRFGGTVVACSRGEYTEALRITSRQPELLLNAVDVDAITRTVGGLSSSPRPGPLSIGTSGRVSAQRGPDVFRLIIELLDRQAPGRFRFIWIGDGPEAHLLRQAGVMVTGWVDRSTALQMINERVDIYIQPSRWEGLPIALLEAMALSKPIVASDIPGNRDVIQNGVTGLLAGSSGEFVQHILLLADNEHLRTEMGTAAREMVFDKHDVGNLADTLAELYAGTRTP